MTMERSIFISYAHIDNQPLTGTDEGWITRFKDALEKILDMRLGSKSNVWRDDKLRGNDVFDEEIIERLAESDVLVPVLSPRYLKSDWCTKEISEFCARAQERGGLSVGNKARVFKIFKSRLESQAPLPEVTRGLLGYEFFTMKEGAPLELDPAYGLEYAQQFNQKVAVLAFHISELLKSLDPEPGPESPVATTASGATASGGANAVAATPTAAAQTSTGKPVVYLAECGYDCKPLRERLEAELAHMGYSVLPDQRLPNDEADYVAAVAQMLERADLSIHLVGEHFGAVPDGPTTKSVAVHQNDQAALRSQTSGMPRLIWMPEKLKSPQALQQTFIDELRTDREARRGADLVTGDFEVLRATMHALLKKIEDARRAPEPVPSSGPAQAGSDDAPLVYVVFDERDREATLPLRKGLKAAGFEVTTPQADGEATQVRQANQSKLAHCDAVLIYYGAGDEFWKRAVRTEMRKLAGYRLDKPPPPVLTYLALPDTSDKSDMAEDEPNVIDGRHALEPADLKRLVEALRQACEAAEPAVA